MIKHKHKIELVRKITESTPSEHLLPILQEKDYILLNQSILGEYSWMWNRPYLLNIPIKELRELKKEIENNPTLEITKQINESFNS